MSLQIRPGCPGLLTDAELYCPDRDIAYCFQMLTAVAINGVRHSDEPWMTHAMRELHVTKEELAQCAVVLAQAISIMANDKTVKSPAEALRVSGFLDSSYGAQYILCAKLGQVMIGAFYTSIRDVTPIDGEPPRKTTLESLVKTAEELQAYIAAPWYKRKLIRLYDWVKSFFVRK